MYGERRATDSSGLLQNRLKKYFMPRFLRRVWEERQQN